MYCPQCNSYRPANETAFCGNCGCRLTQQPGNTAPATAGSSAGAGVDLGRDNVIKDLQLHDSHNVDKSVHNTDNSTHNDNSVTNVTTNNTNTTNNTTVNNNYTTIHEREKSAEELQQASEAEFIAAIEEMCNAAGHISDGAYSELKTLAMKKNIAPQRANQLIDGMRKNVAQKSAGTTNDFLAEKTIKEIMAAVACCNVDVLKQKLPALQQLAKNSTDNNVQFFSNMLNASFNPESCTVELLNSHTDSYWQIYWAAIAFIKKGNTAKAGELLPRLGGFGLPQGDMSLILAISNIADYRKNPAQSFYIQQAKESIEEANHYGISDQLIPVWLAVNQIASDTPSVEDKFRFYYSVTLKELCTTVAPVMPKAVQMPATPPPPPAAAPAMAQEKKIDAQKVNLAQMQGFNPLKAMEQLNNAAMQQPMGMPQMGTMQMPGMPPMGVPPMGVQMPGTPPMGVPPTPGTGTPPPPVEGTPPPFTPNI